MSDINAPAYAVPALPDARGGDPDWKIGVLWGLILVITSLICACALLPLTSFEGSGWPITLYTAWRVTPARLILVSPLYALAGALQLRALRRWLPLPRWWVAAVVVGHLAAVAISYQIARALPEPGIGNIGEVVVREDLPGGLGFALAALAQAPLLGRFSRRAWEWLVPPLVAMALSWIGADLAGAISYLLLGTLALPRLLRAAPEPEVAA